MKWLMRIIGVIWMAAGFALPFYFVHQGWSWNWNALGTLATWVLAGSVWFAFWYIIEVRRSTNAQVAIELFRELRSAEVLETLRFIYRLEPEDVQHLCCTDIHNIESVLDRFELLGALVAQGIIDKRIAIEAYGGPPVLKCWYQLGENYIKKVREQRGLFCKYAEDFTARTLDYQNKHSPEDEWISFRRGKRGKQINLVKEFKKQPELRPKRYK